MKGGKVKNGTAPRKPDGSNPREAAEDKSSVDASEHAKPKGKWLEDYRVLVAWVKEKKYVGPKSGRQSATREVDGNAARDEKREKKGDRDELGEKL